MNIKFSKLLFAICYLIFISISSVQAQSKNQRKKMVGTWVNAKNKQWEWIFSADSTAKEIYGKDTYGPYSFFISNQSPQCGTDVKKWLSGKGHRGILELTNLDNGTEKCYYIYNLSDKVLTLSPFGYASKETFHKRTN